MRVATQYQMLSILCLTAFAFVAIPDAALAFGPAVKYVESVSAYNSTSPKIAVAQCPAGSAVLGGTAVVSGEEGEIAIQAAFPLHDLGLGRHVFVVKAIEDVSGTLGGWSVSAGAYCIDFNVPVYVTQSSAFDSDSIKSIDVECPANMRVVGMGAEVSIAPDVPARLLGTTPPLDVVLQGFETNADLTTVTARATEYGAAIADSWGGNWQITAVAACLAPLYFPGLELKVARGSGGGFLEEEIDSRVDMACPKGKRLLSAASTNYEHDMGQWYLDRFSRYNLVSERLVGEAFRNSGTTLMKQYLYAICADQ
jgi:hypothetical protein